MNSRAHGAAYTISENASLRTRNSLWVEARAALLVEVRQEAALPELLGFARFKTQAPLVLGAGSNILFTRDWPGVVLCLDTRGIEVIDEDDAQVRLRVAAGERWHDFVLWSLAKGWRGLENLALIPGTVGAAPIQNIGAYGVEVAEFIEAVEVWDRASGRLARLDAAACAFGYRDSLFKHERERYIISAVRFRLSRERALRLDYAGLGEELAAMGVQKAGAPQVAEAVMRLRMRKLPDPARIGNAGSFFKNPLVAAPLAQALRAAHPQLPYWPEPDARVKLSAAWLVEQAGCKGLREGDAGMSAQHALVLVNHGSASGAQLWALAQRVREAVRARFGIELEPEPRIV